MMHYSKLLIFLFLFSIISCAKNPDLYDYVGYEPGKRPQDIEEYESGTRQYRPQRPNRAPAPDYRNRDAADYYYRQPVYSNPNAYPPSSRYYTNPYVFPPTKQYPNYDADSSYVPPAGAGYAE